jgi:hypothetical protein
MVYLLRMVIFHGYVSHNQMVSTLYHFISNIWKIQFISIYILLIESNVNKNHMPNLDPTRLWDGEQRQVLVKERGVGVWSLRTSSKMAVYGCLNSEKKDFCSG